jgi:aryl-alcohol dehydrogenase-like predicted oxidoreductase
VLELTRTASPRLGLSLGASRTALECGEFGSTIQALMAEVISTGTRFALLGLNPTAGTGDILNWLGDAIKHARAADEFIVALTLPANLQGSKTTGMQGVPTLVQGYRAEYIQFQVELALQQSRLECIPVMQLEMPDVAAVERQDQIDRYWPELAERLQAMTAQGKVLQWGLALPAPSAVAAQPQASRDTVRHSDDEPPPWVDDFPALLSSKCFRNVSLPYHLFGQSAHRWFAQCAALELAVVATQPLAQGLLSGAIGSTSTFHKRDPRGLRWSVDDLSRAAAAIAEVSRLVKRTPMAAQSSDAAREIIERGRYPAHLIQAENLLELALRFVMAADVSAIALGARSKQQWIESWMASTNVPLTVELLHKLTH